MIQIDVNGLWEGYFTYGPGYPPSYKNKKVTFTIELTETKGLITGKCIDEFVKTHFTEAAKIEGAFENNQITFLKTYPSYLYIDENDKPAVDKSKPSTSILYTGILKKRIFTRVYYFKGNWEISGSYLDQDKIAHYYAVEGKWTMQKK